MVLTSNTEKEQTLSQQLLRPDIVMQKRHVVQLEELEIVKSGRQLKWEQENGKASKLFLIKTSNDLTKYLGCTVNLG